MATTIENNYVGDGSTVLFSFTFEYIKGDDIRVSLDSIDTTDFTLANATTVQFNTPPGNGVAIRIFRDTDIDNTEATFYPGSTIRAKDLNDNFRQTLFVAQEAFSSAKNSDDFSRQALATAAAADTKSDQAIATANTADSNATAAQAAAAQAAIDASTAQSAASSASADAATATAAALAAQAINDAFTPNYQTPGDNQTPVVSVSNDVPIIAENGVQLPFEGVSTYEANGAIRFNDTLDKIELYNGSEWITAAGGATVSTSPPIPASNGDVWYDPDSGRSYIYYVDVDSAQWVEMNPSWNGGIADNTVTTPKITTGAVTTTKVADGSITPVKLDRAYIEPSQLVWDRTGITLSPATAGDKLQLGGGAVDLDAGATGSPLVRDSQGRLLVGTSSSSVGTSIETSGTAISIGGNTNNDAADFRRFEAGTFGPLIFLRKSRNATLGSHTIVNDGDATGGIEFFGSDGTNFVSSARIEAKIDGTPGANDMPGRLVFSVTADGASSPTEALRITNDRYVRLASGSGGIQFNGDTAAANALDDYEEGTFTPVINGTTVVGSGTYTVQTGRYTKIGNRVCFTVHVSWSAHTGTGLMYIGGLPFNVNASEPVAASVVADKLTTPAGTIMRALVINSTTTINLYSEATGGGLVSLVTLDTSGQIFVTGHYTV